MQGFCIRAAIEESRCNWSNKKLGLPHENDLPVVRSVGLGELFPRIGGTEKNLSMTIANQIVRRLIVRRMARPNWYEERKLKMFAGGFVVL